MSRVESPYDARTDTPNNTRNEVVPAEGGRNSMEDIFSPCTGSADDPTTYSKENRNRLYRADFPSYSNLRHDVLVAYENLIRFNLSRTGCRYCAGQSNVSGSGRIDAQIDGKCQAHRLEPVGKKVSCTFQTIDGTEWQLARARTTCWTQRTLLRWCYK